MSTSVGALVQAFLVDELPVQRGLRPASVKAYRDGLRLFLVFVSRDVSCRLTQISSEAFTLDRILRFLQDLETTRHNHRRTRNHRLTILRAFFEFLARRCPEYLAVAQQVATIAVKRAPPPETFFLERDEVERLWRRLPAHGRHALRDRALFLLLYNTGARVQEIADLRIEHLDLGPQPRVRLHGKGDKWRVCPLWAQTVDAITRLLERRSRRRSPRGRSSHPMVRVPSRASACTRSSGAIPTHCGSSAARRSGATSARTSFATRPPYICSKRASTST